MCGCLADIVKLCEDEGDPSLCCYNAASHLPSQPDLDHLDIGSCYIFTRNFLFRIHLISDAKH